MFWLLDFGIWDLFVIWCLRFGISDFKKKAENRDSTVGAAFPDLSLSKVSRDSNNFYDFYAYYDFNDLPITVIAMEGD